jgi:hypothetical protein
MAISTTPGREPGRESRVATLVVAAVLLVLLGLFVYSLVSAYA